MCNNGFYDNGFRNENFGGYNDDYNSYLGDFRGGYDNYSYYPRQYCGCYNNGYRRGYDRGYCDCQYCYGYGCGCGY